ncbi:hypothetical protein [Ferrovibrio terrae]|uniref:hypothetical protein n=1 Tax=Ferrovibrio terrae TaxID=2594003 RepID=UPI00313796E0
MNKEFLLQRLSAFAVVPALLLPLASLPVFEIGQWSRAEPVVIAAHATAALAALALAVLAIAGRLGIDSLRPVWPAAVLALWSLAGGWWQGNLASGLLGAPQSGQGGIWYLDLALWLIIAGLVVRSAPTWRFLTDLAAATGWAVALIAIWGRLSDNPLLIFVTAYYAWPALALPAMLLAHPGGPGWPLRVTAILGATLALLIAADSKTFALIALLSAAFCTLSWRYAGRMSWLQSRSFGLAVVAAAALLPFIVIASGLAAHLGPSMRARVLVSQIVLARLREQWDVWWIGLGWGRTSDAFATHLDIAQAPLWDRAQWDFLERDYFHSHNLLTEAVLAAGLPGAILAIAIPAIPVWLAPSAKRPYAIAFAGAWLLALGVWFELAFALPVFALAVAALCHTEATARSFAAGRTRYLAGGLAIAAAIALFATAAMLLQQARSADQVIAWLKTPHASPPSLVDLRGDDRILAAIVSDTMQDMKDRANANPLVVEAEAHRLKWMVAALDDRMSETRNPALPIVGSNLLVDLALNQNLSVLRDPLAELLPRWPQWLDRAMVLAPGRSDLPIGYLSWRLTLGDYSEVLIWARRLRVRDPDDPVGLYYEGGVFVLQSDPQLRQQGLVLLRRALDRGVGRYIPLDEDFKAKIRIPAG